MFIPKNVFKCYNKYRKLYLYLLMHFCSIELLEFISISFANWLEFFALQLRQFWCGKPWTTYSFESGF